MMHVFEAMPNDPQFCKHCGFHKFSRIQHHGGRNGSESIPSLTVEVTGRPLSELGLDRVRIINAEGEDIGSFEEVIPGLVVPVGMRVIDAVRQAMPAGFSAVFTGEQS